MPIGKRATKITEKDVFFEKSKKTKMDLLQVYVRNVVMSRHLKNFG